MSVLKQQKKIELLQEKTRKCLTRKEAQSILKKAKKANHKIQDIKKSTSLQP